MNRLEIIKYLLKKHENLILPKKTLQWLLEDNNPPIRNLTTKFLQNKDLTETEIKQVNSYPPISSLLSLLKPDGSWTDPKKPYKKYTGNYWQFIFLCDLNTNPDYEKIHKAAETIFSYQLPTGNFPHELGYKKGIQCLTANLLRSFLHFGYEKDERVQKGIKLITNQIIDNNGATCIDLITNLLPDCQMTLTKILAMYAHIDEKKGSSSIKKAIKIIEDKIVENRVFYYIPAGVKEYQKAIKGKKISQKRQIKKQMLNQPEKMEKIGIKNSWRKFGFPNSYTSDALETLYWTAMSGIPNHSEFDIAINYVIKRMDRSGYWINEINFRSPFLVEIEPKKSPSKWLTFRACFVLKKYRSLEFTS